MGNYWYSTEEIQEKPLQTYCINSYSDCNLIIDYIERNNEGDIVIYYTSPENL